MQACSVIASNIACRRGDRLLFTGLSFEMASGEALHLAGPNGIGKSSLIRIIAGLLRPYEGSVTREGNIALIDEHPALDENLPLGQAIAFWAGLDGCASVSANPPELGIASLLDVPVRFLSTGQRKRAAFVRMLNQGSEIWLLDEPLNGLDTDARDKVLALMRLHCSGGGICIIASHQPLKFAEIKSLEIAEFAR